MDSLKSTIGLGDITEVEGVLPEDMLAGLMAQGVLGSDAGLDIGSNVMQSPTKNSNPIPDHIEFQNLSKVFAPKPEDPKAIQARKEEILRLRKIRAEKLIRDHQPKTRAQILRQKQRRIKNLIRAGKVAYKFDRKNLKVTAILRSNHSHLTKIALPPKVMDHFRQVKDSFVTLHSNIENFQKTLLNNIYKRWLKKAFIKRLFWLKLKEDKQNSYQRYRTFKHRINAARVQAEHKVLEKQHLQD